MNHTDSGGREWKEGDVVRGTKSTCLLVKIDGAVREPYFEGVMISGVTAIHSNRWIIEYFQLCCQTCHAATGGKRWCAEHEPKAPRNFEPMGKEFWDSEIAHWEEGAGKHAPSPALHTEPLDLEATARELALDMDAGIWTLEMIQQAVLSKLQQVDAAARDSFQNRIEGERNRYQQAISVANHHRKLAEQERYQARAELAIARGCKPDEFTLVLTSERAAREELTQVRAEIARLQVTLADIQANPPPSSEQWHAVCDERDAIRAKYKECLETLQQTKADWDEALRWKSEKDRLATMLGDRHEDDRPSPPQE